MGHCDGRVRNKKENVKQLSGYGKIRQMRGKRKKSTLYKLPVIKTVTEM